MERLVSFYIRKWLGVPRCLSTVALCGKGILQLLVSSLVEEFKCTDVRTELLLAGSKDVDIHMNIYHSHSFELSPPRAI